MYVETRKNKRNRINYGQKLTTANSGFTKWRNLWYIHVYFPQEILSLTENNQFRSSPLREAAKRYAQF